MKNGIALFSTLMILVLVIMLMAISLKNSTNIKITTLKDRYIIQENTTITDIVKLIENKLIPKLEKLKGESKVKIQKILFENPVIIKNSVTNSIITVTMYPNDGKQNINFINSTEGKKFIKNIFDVIGVKEPEVLSNIVLANITNSDKYSDDYKLHLKNKNKTFGYVQDQNSFYRFIDIYVQNTDDQDVYTIDFNKYFNFYENSAQKYNRIADNILDINYIKIELIDSVINLNNDVRKLIKDKSILFSKYTQLELDTDSSDKDILKNHGFEFETQNILLKINTKSINNRIEYLLNYNLTTKKISNISMDRWIY